MTTEANKAVVRQLLKGLNTHDLDVIDRVFAPGFTGRTPGPDWPTRVSGPQGIKRYFQNYLASFPDLSITIREVIAESDKVVAYVSVAGSHDGEFLGIPATHRHTTTAWAMIFRLTDGLITEAWDIEDELTLLRQLGVTLVPGGHD